MKKLLKNAIIKQKFRFLTVVILLIIIQISKFRPASIIGNIIDKIGLKESVSKDFLILLIFVIIYCITRTFYKYLMKKIVVLIHKDLSDELFKKFLNLKLKETQKIKNGELMSYITRYIKDIRRGIYSIVANGIRTVITFSIITIIMFRISPQLSGIIAIPIIIDGIIMNILKSKIKQSEAKAQSEFTKMSEYVQESTDSVRVTKAFNGEEQRIRSFNEKSNNVERNYTKAWIYSAWMQMSMSLCFGISYALTAIVGIKLILSDTITVGEFIAFNVYIKDLKFPLEWIPKLITYVKKMQVAYCKLEEFCKLEEEKTDDNEKIITGDIEIKNLNFSYIEGKEVLKNIDFRIKKGEKVGIIGTIGSGKTTIANLLLKLYDIDDGQIFIGGQDINKIDTSSLRKSFCYITQESFLFSTSVKENTTVFDKKYSDEKIQESTELAALTDDLKNMENGIDTIIGEKGITLSGGQKQRVAISRAFLYNKNFVIFDDTFSALDNKTEKIILDNLRGVMKEKTCIIISNRISDVKMADKIIVLDKGEIIQKGTHKKLLAEDGLYREFYNEQSSNEFLNEEFLGVD